MKHSVFSRQASLAASMLVLVVSAQAHEPEKHMKEAEEPDCAAMKPMDSSEMDRDDPVMQAMMQKCMGEMRHDESGPEGSHTDHSGKYEKDGGKRPSGHEH